MGGCGGVAPHGHRCLVNWERQLVDLVCGTGWSVSHDTGCGVAWCTVIAWGVRGAPLDAWGLSSWYGSRVSQDHKRTMGSILRFSAEKWGCVYPVAFAWLCDFFSSRNS